MSQTRIARRWRRNVDNSLERLAVLVNTCLAEGSADQVHELRVLVRRLRVLFQIGKGIVSARGTDRFRQLTRRLSNLSGPVRDLDIAIESLKNEAVPARLRAWLEGRRARAFRQFIAQAPMLSPRFVLTLRVGGLGSAQARRIERRLMAQCDKLAPGIVHEAGRYHAMELDDRHELRRTIRRLRYLREVALPRRTQPKDALIQLLIGAQEALGEIQNCLVAEATLAQAQKLRGADALRAGLQQQRTAWERTAVRRLEMLLDWLQENGLDGG